MVPTGNEVINDRFSTGGPNYREFLYLLTNLAGAGQSFDGNGPFLRSQLGGGNVLVGEPNPNSDKSTKSAAINYAKTAENPLGNQPQLAAKPPLKPDVRCDTNPVPDLNGRLGQVGTPTPSVAGVNP